MKSNSDLSALESVRSGDGPSIISIMLGIGGIVSLITFAIALFLTILGKYIDLISGLVVAGCSLVVSIAALLVLRLSVFDHRWETDSEGVTADKPFGRKRIEWRNVTEAKTLWVNLILGRRHMVTDGRTTIYVPDSDPHIAASLWYYLKKLNMAADIELSSDAASFWQELPETPLSVKWSDPHSRPIIKVMVGVVLLFGFLILIHYTVKSAILEWFLTILAAGFVDICFRPLTTVQEISIDQYGFEAKTTIGDYQKHWGQVKSATWGGVDNRIDLKLSWWRTLHIPWDRDDKESSALSIAIIDRLANQTPQILLPRPDGLVASSAE